MGKSLDLFISFGKIGTFTIGGGYAMIPLIEREVIVNKKWIERKQFLELLTLAQSAPGPISLNISVFVGYKVNGIKGALAAISGIILPSFVIMLVIAIFFFRIRDNPTIIAVFKGIGPAVVALIIAPVLGLAKGLTLKQYILAALALASILYFKFSPAYLIIAGAVIGIIYGLYKSHRP